MLVHTQTLRCKDSAARRARTWAGVIVGDIVADGEKWRDGVEDDAVACASELVTASLIGGGTSVTIRLLSDDGFFRMSLVDRYSSVRAPLDPSLCAQMMGLRLVEALADRWGIAPAYFGREIWAEFFSGTGPDAEA